MRFPFSCLFVVSAALLPLGARSSLRCGRRNAAGVTAPHRLHPAESSAPKLNWMSLCWYPVSRFI